jgi:UDP-glucose 4-epimerase
MFEKEGFGVSNHFITGAGGFIGKHLIRKLLLSEKNPIICIDKYFAEQFCEEFGDRVIMCLGDLNDLTFIQHIFNDYSPNYIYHLAGLKNRTNRYEEFKNSMDVNYYSTLNLLQAVVNNQDLKKIVMIGTAEEYGDITSPFNEDSRENPTSAYGLSKLAATKLSKIFYREFDVPVVVIRPTIAYGPGQGMEMFIPSMINALCKNEKFLMTKGEQLRDIIYIDDLIVALHLAAINDDSTGTIINVGSGKSVTIRGIAEYVGGYLGKKELLEFGSRAYRNFELMNYGVDIQKAKRLLNWSPGWSMESGLIETIKYFKDQ